MQIERIWRKADALQGCLGHLKTAGSRRRREDNGEDPLRIPNPFLGDEAKLLSSKAFRALKEKTQVFSYPSIPLIRYRQAHVLEVAACGVVTADLLGLNTDLVRAAAIGHDIGHVPFGHQGEHWFAKRMGRPFCHEVFGVVVAQKIERGGKGLNLTWHALEAMLRHSGATARENASQEARLIRYADKFAYLFADVNDIFGRMRYPMPPELRALLEKFGANQRERTTTAMAGLVIESAECGEVSFERSELGEKFKRVRDLMYGIYPKVTQQDVAVTLDAVLKFLEMIKIGDPFLILALMTDRDVARIASETMKDIQCFNLTAVAEIVPHLAKIGAVDMCDPDLDW